MPYCENREYRSMAVMKPTEAKAEQLIDTDYYVEGFATTFNQPYLLYRDDNAEYFEQVSPTAFDAADLSDVLYLHNHEGKCFARTKMRQDKAPTLILDTRPEGLFVAADLGMTAEGRDEWAAISGGLVYQMSFAFTVKEDTFDEFEKGKYLRTITSIRKVYDVSSVDMPANPYTFVNTLTRSAFDGAIEKLAQERRRAEEELIAKRKLIALIKF